MKSVRQKNTEQSRKGDYRMKKLIAVICMITCVLGLSACGSETQYTEYEQSKITYAQQLASESFIPLLESLTKEENSAILEMFEEYTYDEVAYVLSTGQYSNSYPLNADGYAFMTAITSFDSALDEIGQIVQIGSATGEIDDDQIIVRVEVVGTNKKAEAELIFSNDMFMTLESAALNLEESLGELMGKAALNTVIGMGTVFLVLILISLIISCFGVIPKIQASFANRKAKRADKKNKAQETGIDKAVAQIVGQEENVTDDLELVAVIAAAIAASEGQTSTDGFVVRSIRRR